MGQYHDLYLKSDVLQLGCVFERFRDECMFNYGLDPAHFYTSPGLAWSAALKCRLHLITDPDMYLFVEAGMRGGISQISNRLVHTKKKLLKQVAKSSFERCQVFNKDLVAVQLKKTVLTLNKPISVGMSILELSKCVIFNHPYNYVMRKYGHDRAKLMMTDTDSLLYHITT